jgi:hypothetical protein
VEVADDLLHPRVELERASYGIRLHEARPNDPPLIVRNRPREVVFNLAHKVFAGDVRPSAIEMVMALELSYLIAATRADEDLYDSVLSLLETS